MYYFGLTSLEVSTLWFIFLVILYRMSFGFVHTPLTNIVLKALPNDRPEYGVGFGRHPSRPRERFWVAFGSAILEHRTLVHLIGLGEGHEVSTLSVRETAATVAQLLMQAGELGGVAGGKTLAVLREHLLQQAQMAAYQDTFLLLCAVTLLAFLPALLSHTSRGSFKKQVN